jgi:cell division protein FtsN
MKKLFFLAASIAAFFPNLLAQTPKKLKIEIKVSDSMQAKFVQGGRLLLHLSRQIEAEPRSKSDVTIGFTPADWNPKNTIQINTKDKNVMISNTAKISDTSTGKFYVQVGSFFNSRGAKERLAKTKEFGKGKVLIAYKNNKRIYRSVFGPFKTKKSALKLRDSVIESGNEAVIIKGK